MLSVLISSLLDFFILGACVGRPSGRPRTYQKVGRPNLLSVLISSLLDFFILGACVEETRGQAKNPPAQNQSETSKSRPPQFAIGSHSSLLDFFTWGACVGETIGQAQNLSKIRPPQFAIGCFQLLTRFLHFWGLCGGDHRTGQEPIKN